MSMQDAIRRAAAATRGVVAGVQPDQLGGPTPCTEWDVRELGNHMTGFLAYTAAAARKQTPMDDSEEMPDLTAGDWASTYASMADDAVAAWSDPAAFEGTTHFGPGPMPAQNAAAVTLMELVVHGWDLAEATGQSVRYDDDVVATVQEIVAGSRQNPNSGDFFAPEITVDEAASAMEQMLAKSGRSPSWSG